MSKQTVIGANWFDIYIPESYEQMLVVQTTAYTYREENEKKKKKF